MRLLPLAWGMVEVVGFGPNPSDAGWAGVSPGSGSAAGSDPGPRVADLATPPTHMTTYLRGHSNHGAVQEHDTQ